MNNLWVLANRKGEYFNTDGSFSRDLSNAIRFPAKEKSFVRRGPGEYWYSYTLAAKENLEGDS